jgi:hypothetical protein
MTKGSLEVEGGYFSALEHLRGSTCIESAGVRGTRVVWQVWANCPAWDGYRV